MQQRKRLRRSAGAFGWVAIITFSIALPTQKSGDIKWSSPCGGDATGAGRPWLSKPCGAGRRAYSDTGSLVAICWAIVRCGFAPAAAAWRHRRTRGAGRDRRFLLFVAPAEADIGQTLQQRHSGLLRMLFFALAPGLPDFILRRHRQILEVWHPRRARRRAFRRLRNKAFGRQRLTGLDFRGVLIREQRRLLRDRADRDIAIGCGLQRRERRLRGFRGPPRR